MYYLILILYSLIKVKNYNNKENKKKAINNISNNSNNNILDLILSKISRKN